MLEGEIMIRLIRGIAIVGLSSAMLVAAGTTGFGAETSGPQSGPGGTTATQMSSGSESAGAREETAWMTITLTKKKRQFRANNDMEARQGGVEQKTSLPVVEVYTESMMSYKLIDDIPIKDMAGRAIALDQLRLPAVVSARTYTVRSGEVVIQEMNVLRELEGATSAWEAMQPL